MKKNKISMLTIMFLFLVFFFFINNIIAFRGYISSGINYMKRYVFKSSSENESNNEIVIKNNTNENNVSEKKDELVNNNEKETDNNSYLTEESGDKANIIDKINYKVGKYKSIINKVTGSVENTVNTEFPLRNKIVKEMNRIDINLFNNISSDQVIIGKEEWLFYKSNLYGDDSMADYQGTNHFSTNELNLIRKNLTKINNEYKNQNKEFYLVIIPNKEIIYSEYMPDHIKRETTTTRADLLVEYLNKNSDINIIYPKNELLKQKSTMQTYYKYDTHWNYFGTFIGYNEILKSIGLQTTDQSNFKWIKSQKKGGDLANLLQLNDYYRNDYEIKIKNYKENVDVNLLKNENGIYITDSTAKDNRKVYIFHDSFGEHLKEYFPYDFKNVKFASKSSHNQNEVNEYNPDIVIYELNERTIGNLLYYNY